MRARIPARAVSATGSAKKPARLVMVMRWPKAGQSRPRYSPKPTDSSCTQRKASFRASQAGGGLPKTTSQAAKAGSIAASSAMQPWT